LTTDKDFIKRRFSASFREYELLAHTQREICGQLAAMQPAGLQPARILEVGAGTGFLTRLLTEACPGAHWILNDLAESSESYLEPYVGALRHEYLWGDAEAVDFPRGLDLLASASTVQWFDDLPAFFAKCAAATAPGGLLALSTFGEDNFMEIKALTGRGLEYPTLPQLEAMLRAAGYRIEQSVQYTSRLQFASPADVQRHIRVTGVGMQDRKPWTRGRLAEFAAGYAARFPHENGGVALTYHPILCIARRG
jgi:malonyl-CoA O-methyltransferase